MNRWLILSVGLAIAAAAAYALLARAPGGQTPPLDRIDEASRARLENVLRDSEEGGRR